MEQPAFFSLDNLGIDHCLKVITAIALILCKFYLFIAFAFKTLYINCFGL